MVRQKKSGQRREKQSNLKLENILIVQSYMNIFRDLDDGWEYDIRDSE